MKLITYAIAPLFFVAINQAIAGTWKCPEKTSDGNSVYTILFDSPEKDTNIITMRHINIKTNKDAFGALNLKVTRGDSKNKIATHTTPYTISTYYFDLKRGLVTRSKTNGSIASGNLIETTYKCKI